MHDSWMYVIGITIFSGLAVLAALGVIAILFMERLQKKGKIETKKGVYTWTPKEASKTE